jgi:signal transduction histidine kinase
MKIRAAQKLKTNDSHYQPVCNSLKLNAIPRRWLIKVFKESIEAQEQTSKAMAKHLHAAIFPLLAVLKIKLHIHINDLKKRRLGCNNLYKEKEIIDKITDDLRKLYNELHRPTLEYLGLIKTLESCTRLFSQKNPI